MMRGYDYYDRDADNDNDSDDSDAAEGKRTDDEIAQVERNEVCPAARRQPRLLPSDVTSPAPPFDRNASSSSQCS